MAEITFDGVTKIFGDDIRAVDELSLHVDDGEFMVLVGPSGCGKTTALRMLAGLEDITSGSLSIGGTVVNNVLPKDRDVAMVFQNYALYPHMTVAQNMGFALKIRGQSKAEVAKKVGEAAAILRLTEYLDRRPKALSGGQRQRVAMGRAIVRNPKVFLFDEPLSNLDAALRVNTRNELIRQHHRLGSTMIYVTHDQVEAMTMGSRICVMNGGRVAQIGAPLEVYWNPADTFVARFLGSPPMNLLDLPVRQEGGRFFAGTVEAGVPLTNWRTDQLAPHVGQSLTLGVRAEDLHLRDDAGAGCIPATVFAVEPLGAETLIAVEADGGGAEWLARLGRETQVRAGDRVTLRFAPEDAYLFDPRSTRAIPREARP